MRQPVCHVVSSSAARPAQLCVACAHVLRAPPQCVILWPPLNESVCPRLAAGSPPVGAPRRTGRTPQSMWSHPAPHWTGSYTRRLRTAAKSCGTSGLAVLVMHSQPCVPRPAPVVARLRLDHALMLGATWGSEPVPPPSQSSCGAACRIACTCHASEFHVCLCGLATKGRHLAGKSPICSLCVRAYSAAGADAEVCSGCALVLCGEWFSLIRSCLPRTVRYFWFSADSALWLLHSHVDRFVLCCTLFSVILFWLSIIPVSVCVLVLEAGGSG